MWARSSKGVLQMRPAGGMLPLLLLGLLLSCASPFAAAADDEAAAPSSPLLPSSSTAPSAAAAAAIAARQAHARLGTKSILRHLDATRQAIYGFWQHHGPDTQHGGFHGTLDLAGEAVAPTAKGLVQQARHIWAFSTYHKFGYTRSAAHPHSQASSSSSSSSASSALPSSQQMAKTAYDFVVQHMHDPDSGMFVWNVTREGQVVQPNKCIYGEWFVLYSFSQYFSVFGDVTARDLALQCFKAMDESWHNSEFGGYDETPYNQIPPTPAPAAAASMRDPHSSSSSSRGLTEAGASASSHSVAATPAVAATRTLNVAMHGLEALTALHKITQDQVVLQRILEYLRIICVSLARQNGLIFEEYVLPASSTEPWQPAPGTVVNYGHNLESTWLVADTLDYLLSIQAITPALAGQYRDAVMSIGAAAVRDGFDRQHGGVYEAGSAHDGPRSRVKVWWIQAEAMLALWKLHEHFEGGDAAAAAAGVAHPEASSSAHHRGSDGGRGHLAPNPYLQALADTARFVLLYVTDVAGSGEQFWQVQSDGTEVRWGDIDKDTKGNRWKASYHDSRSVLFLEEWIKQAGH